MAWPLGADAQRLVRHGVGQLFTLSVRRLYRTLTGEEPREAPLSLLERLFHEDRLTPEAALHLLVLARALREAQVPLGTAATLRDQVRHGFDRTVERFLERIALARD